ncbi:MAG TPA: hypothetical protein VEL79_10315 [Vicinamibacterales bacterium]|nr:hypothetical protein [Vicinamibacterales bacterium]
MTTLHALLLLTLATPDVHASRLAPRASQVVIDRIMAVVGGQPIMLSDVDAAIQFQLTDVPQGAADPLATTLGKLIERTLILAEVERFQPPEPDPVEITVRMDAMERRAGSAAAFEKALAVTGTSREQLRRYIRDDLRITTYLNQRFVTLSDPKERNAAIAAWVAELKKRAEISVLYRTP